MKTQVIKDICNELLRLPRYIVGIILHQHQRLNHSIRRHFIVLRQRKQMIAAERACQSSSHYFDGDKGSLKNDDSVHFAVE